MDTLLQALADGQELLVTFRFVIELILLAIVAELVINVLFLRRKLNKERAEKAELRARLVKLQKEKDIHNLQREVYEWECG